jgi:hypothetical protein
MGARQCRASFFKKLHLGTASSCSATERPFHQVANSPVNSTSQDMLGVCHSRNILSMEYYLPIPQESCGETLRNGMKMLEAAANGKLCRA